MAEATSYMFDLRETAEALIIKQGVHEGHWGVSIEFGQTAANVPTGLNTIGPAAISIVMHIGIKLFPEPNSLTVDAAEVNPSKAVIVRRRSGGVRAQPRRVTKKK